MLSVHGLVIIAEAPEITLMNNGKGAFVKMQVSSPDEQGVMHRNNLSTWVNLDQLEILKSEYTPGKICDISHGVLTEYISPTPDTFTNKIWNKLYIKADYRNIKILANTLYYKDINGITKQIGE